MILKQLQIQNFKCFQSRQTIDFGRLTILTGANSSGKSSILYSILGAIQSGEFPFQFSPNGKYVNMGDFREISFNHKENSEIGIEFTFEESWGLQNIKTVWTENKENHLPELKYLELKGNDFQLEID